MIIVPPCYTSWSLAGWRAWRDRILYGHDLHTCRHTNHTIGGHICRCGATLPGWPVRNTHR